MRIDPGPEIIQAGLLVRRADLEGRLDSFILDRMDPGRQEFVIREVTPRLSWNRLDLAIKLFYLERLAKGPSAFARELYDAHIHAFSLGAFRERGNDAKVSAAGFRSAFAEIADSIRTEGFDPERSLVPVASDGSFINGGHRTACAIHFGHKVHVVETGLGPVRYDQEFFRRRGMDEDLLDAAVVEYIARQPRTEVVLVRPGRRGAREIEALVGPLVGRKSVALTSNGLGNLQDDFGLGSSTEGVGAWGRPVERQRTQLLFLAYEREEGQDLDLSTRLRVAAERGGHAIHCAESHEQSLDLARIFLNDRSLRVLNTAKPRGTPMAARMARAFGDVLDQAGVPREEVLFGPQMVLAAFGVQEASKLDVLSPMPLDGATGELPVATLPCHEDIRDLIEDPRRHFHRWGLKFLSVDQALQASWTGTSGHDPARISQLEALKARAEVRRPARKLLYRMRLFSSTARHAAIWTVRLLGLREPAHRIYKALKRRGR